MNLIPFLLGLILSGCAGNALQSENIKAGEEGLAPAAKVKGVPFVRQGKNYCGPAAVSMAFAWAGKPMSVETAGAEVFTPNAEGTFQMDIVSAARRQGLLPMNVSSMKDLLKELEQGAPVMVFQNLGFDWYKLWHYSVVTGYDLEEKTVTLNSGNKEGEVVPFNHFERGWRRGGYWGLLVLPPEKLSASSSAREHLMAAAALEKAKREKAAETSYRKILEKWRDNPWARFALGNIAYKNKDFQLAKSHLERAAQTSPASPYVWHNYALVLEKVGESASAKTAAKTALENASPDQGPSFKKSLGHLLN